MYPLQAALNEIHRNGLQMYTGLLQHRFELPQNNAKYRSFVLYSFGAVLNNFPQICFEEIHNARLAISYNIASV